MAASLAIVVTPALENASAAMRTILFNGMLDNCFFVVGPTGLEYRASLACSSGGNVVDMVVVKPKMLPEDKAFVQGSVCTLIGILRAPLAGPLVIRAPGQQEGADSVGHEDSENFYALSPGLLPCAPCEPSICKQ